MRAVITGNGGASDGEWCAARDEALSALRDALWWNLPASRWEQLQNIVADMAAAVAAASVDAPWQTTGRLAACGPLRVVTRLGDAPQLPAPQAARERITELIHALIRDGDLKTGHEPGLDPRARS